MPQVLSTNRRPWNWVDILVLVAAAVLSAIFVAPVMLADVGRHYPRPFLVGEADHCCHWPAEGSERRQASL
jgi:hypothetical protein